MGGWLGGVKTSYYVTPTWAEVGLFLVRLDCHNKIFVDYSLLELVLVTVAPLFSVCFTFIEIFIHAYF